MAERGSHDDGGGDQPARGEPGAATGERGARLSAPALPEGRFRGLGLRPQILLSLALLMATVLGLLAFGTHALVPLAIRREVGEARKAMGHALARELAGRHGDPAAARVAIRTALAEPGVDGAAVWDRDQGLVARGAPPGAADFPGGHGPSFSATREEGAGSGVVVLEPTADRAGCAAVRVGSGPTTGPLQSAEGLLLGYLGLSALAIVVFGYIAVTRLVVRPIERLTGAARRLGRVREASRVAPGGGRELVELTETFNAMAEQVTTQRGELEAKVASLEQLNRDLGRAQEQVIRSAKLASVGQLAAGIAHEIGNPLTVMLGFFDVLDGTEGLPGDARDHLRTMRQEAERVNRIIRDLLDYARANPLPIEPLPLGEVIDGTVGLLAPQKPFRAIEIQVTVPSDLPPVRGNRDRLRQVLVNLLLNAAEAIGEGSGTVSVRAERVASEGKAAVRMLVADSGPGIPAELLETIFDPFVTTKPPGAGTGLGLAVVQAILEGLGGTIRASNLATGGACFEVVLPVF